MKLLLAAINAKYIHSNPAVYSLRAYAERTLRVRASAAAAGAVGTCEIDIAEYTINQRTEDILADIYRRRPDVLCFSCYIWNIACTEAIVREAAKLLPDTDIWLGGPEVSYDAQEVLGRLPQVKGVMKGEGEAVFADMCRLYAEEGDVSLRDEAFDEALMDIRGITYRSRAGYVYITPWREPLDLDDIPFIYGDMPDGSSGSGGAFADFSHRIIYYETSRGCPFSCSYCLSSIDKRLRFRSFGLVREELQYFLDRRVPQVKFVDRTFNCNHAHAMEIWRYIAEHDNGVTNFHFEIAADLLDEEELALMETMRPGLIQLEIGVQSVNPETIREIRRTMDLGKLRANVARVKRGGNIHQHLDLIAGLPCEDMESFARSYDEVYGMEPDQLQLGFLKVLKGSYMEKCRSSYGLAYTDSPPYEVLYTRWLSYADVRELKGVEEMTEVYYNSAQFANTLRALREEYASAFGMFRELWHYYEKNGYTGAEHRRSARYEILLGFVREHLPHRAEEFRELLILDYYLRENAKTRPGFAGEYTVDKDFLRDFYETEERERRYLPGYEAYDRNQMRRMTHIERFPLMGKILLFDYKYRNPLNQSARTCMIESGVIRRKD